MIKIKYNESKVTISGHANYKEKEDIVCASVSSIMYTTLNAIMRFDKKAINFIDDGNVVTINILKNDKTTETLIINMLSLFNELALEYEKNVLIEEE